MQRGAGTQRMVGCVEGLVEAIESRRVAEPGQCVAVPAREVRPVQLDVRQVRVRGFRGSSWAALSKAARLSRSLPAMACTSPSPADNHETISGGTAVPATVSASLTRSRAQFTSLTSVRTAPVEPSHGRRAGEPASRLFGGPPHGVPTPDRSRPNRERPSCERLRSDNSDASASRCFMRIECPNNHLMLLMCPATCCAKAGPGETAIHQAQVIGLCRKCLHQSGVHSRRSPNPFRKVSARWPGDLWIESVAVCQLRRRKESPDLGSPRSSSMGYPNSSRITRLVVGVERWPTRSPYARRCRWRTLSEDFSPIRRASASYCAQSSSYVASR